MAGFSVLLERWWRRFVSRLIKITILNNRRDSHKFTKVYLIVDCLLFIDTWEFSFASLLAGFELEVMSFLTVNLELSQTVILITALLTQIWLVLCVPTEVLSQITTRWKCALAKFALIRTLTRMTPLVNLVIRLVSELLATNMLSSWSKNKKWDDFKTTTLIYTYHYHFEHMYK